MSNKNPLLFLGLAVLFGIGAVFTARNYIEQRAGGPIAAEVRSVVVAAEDLSVSVSLSARDLREISWPADHLPEQAISDPHQLEGRVLRRAIAAGEPIFESALLPEGSAAGLPSLISADHRAVSVKVDAVVGVAGFVKPGARVDVLATLRRSNAANFSNVILQDVRVLAVDQTLEEVDNGKPKVVNVATLEVSTAEAERLVHAAHEGRLQLALRSPGDQVVLPTRAVQASDLLGAPRATGSAPRPGVQVLKGTSLSNETL